MVPKLAVPFALSLAANFCFLAWFISSSLDVQSFHPVVPPGNWTAGTRPDEGSARNSQLGEGNSSRYSWSNESEAAAALPGNSSPNRTANGSSSGNDTAARPGGAANDTANASKELRIDRGSRPPCQAEDVAVAARNGTWVRYPGTGNLSEGCARGGSDAETPLCRCQRASEWRWEPDSCALGDAARAQLKARSKSGRPVYFIGDSVTQSMFRMMLHFLPPDCKERKAQMGHKGLCLEIVCKQDVVATYYQNDFLCIDCDGWAFLRKQRDWEGMGGNALDLDMQSAHVVLSSGEKWHINHVDRRPEIHGDPAVRILQKYDLFRANVRAFMAKLVSAIGPSGSIIWRLDWVGHSERCSRNTEPLSIAPEHIVDRYKSIVTFNQIGAEECARLHQCTLLDVRHLSSLRPDAHPGSEIPPKECVLFCKGDEFNVKGQRGVFVRPSGAQPDEPMATWIRLWLLMSENAGGGEEEGGDGDAF